MKRFLAIVGTFTCLLAACSKSDIGGVKSGGQSASNSNDERGTVAAKINNRQWRSELKADTNTYLAAINAGVLQIKTIGAFTDSLGGINNDQLAMYIEGVTDTGVYMLNSTNYITYSELFEIPSYFTSQRSNMGWIHITNLSDTAVSGSFECMVDNTSGSGSFLIKEGTFSDVILQ